VLVSGTSGRLLDNLENPLRGTGIMAKTVKLVYSLASSVKSIGGKARLASKRPAISSSGTMLSLTSICGGKKACVNPSVFKLGKGKRPAGGSA
jgi:hypothetical protein